MLAFPELVPTELDHPSADAMLRVRERLPAGGSRPSCSSPTPTRSSPGARRATGGAIPGAGPAEIVAGAGHFLQEDKGEEIAERIVRFLRET